MVLDQKSGKEIQVFEGHEHVVECIAFSTPRADEIISRKRKKANTPANLFRCFFFYFLFCWFFFAIAKNQNKLKMKKKNKKIYYYYFSEKENDEEFLKPWYIASGCRDRSIRIWDINTGNCVMKLVCLCPCVCGCSNKKREPCVCVCVC